MDSGAKIEILNFQIIRIIIIHLELKLSTKMIFFFFESWQFSVFHNNILHILLI